MMTEKGLFEILHQRGCRILPPRIHPEDSPDTVQKKEQMGQRISAYEDGLGRVHPSYSRSDTGRVRVRNPNIYQYRFDDNPGGRRVLVEACPDRFEAGRILQDIGADELARDLVQHGWGVLGYTNLAEQQVAKILFYHVAYGVTPTRIPSGTWGYMVSKNPVLSIFDSETREQRLDRVKRVQRWITEVTLQVACAFEDMYAGPLVSICREGPMLESECPSIHLKALTELYREHTNLPILFGKAYTDPAPQISRLSLLFEEA